MRLKELHKVERPREKMAKYGPESLKDEELMAILLRTGYRGKNVLELSREILKKFPKERWEGVTHEQLSRQKGIGPSRAAALLAARELGRRLNGQKEGLNPVLDRPEKVAAQVGSLKGKMKEYFVALYLNARNQLIHQETVSVGTLSSSLVHPREVFSWAVSHGAAGVIVVHNHPSQDSSPSNEDKEVTRRLQKAGEVLGIELLDHVIVTDENYFSFKEHRLI